MEIVIVVLLVVILATLVLAWTRLRPGAGAGGRHAGRGEGIRARRGGGGARHDPMAEAVERHAMATDPHEAAEAELALQAQANRVAADLHAQQASSLESELHRNANGGRSPRRGPAYGADAPLHDDDRRDD